MRFYSIPQMLFFSPIMLKGKMHLWRIIKPLRFLDSHGLSDQNYNYASLLLKLIENFMTFWWNLAGNYYAGISSAYVVTFDLQKILRGKHGRPNRPSCDWRHTLRVFPLGDFSAGIDWKRPDDREDGAGEVTPSGMCLLCQDRHCALPTTNVLLKN